MIGNRLHQPAGGACAAQTRIGLDMGQDIAIFAVAVIGEHQKPIFAELKALLFHIVDHLFWPGSRYIQGSDRPMGTIHMVPARA